MIYILTHDYLCCASVKYELMHISAPVL